MSRYIDADALKMELYSIAKADCGYTADVLAGLMIAERVIDNAQTADVAPVRHGQWERIGIIGRKGLQIYPCCLRLRNGICGIQERVGRATRGVEILPELRRENEV